LPGPIERLPPKSTRNVSLVVKIDTPHHEDDRANKGAQSDHAFGSLAFGTNSCSPLIL
jgi:hypothetical protein